MWLTGLPDGPPLPPRGDPAGAVAAMLDVWRAASGLPA
ncbi:MAG: hypothetical protein JWP31_597, partial [Aeromicrobium sp.]|nr:hypothetical protein [Aeromicrobium sp.]